MLAAARFMQSTTQRSDVSNWLIGDNTMWYNTTRKASPLVTHTVAGTPSTSVFTLNAAGVWLIEAHGWSAQSLILYICRGAITDAASEVSSGAAALRAGCSLLREFDQGADVRVRLNMAAAGLLAVGNDDANHISFAYLGAV